MKILLTGSNGVLGSAIKEVLRLKGHLCVPYSIDRVSNSWEKDLQIEIIKNDFDAIIHSAANTDVELCEKFEAICYNDNTLLTEKIAILANNFNLKLIFISSTGVYGEYKDTPYSESDYLRPTTNYHKSKALSEDFISSLSSENLIIRTGWLFGGDIHLKKNFVANRIKEAKENYLLHANAQQKGNPCFNIDIAIRIIELIENKMTGIFNCVNNGEATRFEYVYKIVEYAGLNNKIIPSDSSFFKRLASVSNNETATNDRARNLNFAELPDWEISLNNYIKTIISD